MLQPMAKNINCKKSWHPTRFETQSKIKEYKMKENMRKSKAQEVLLELSKQNDDFAKLQRMKWMESQE